MSAEQGNTVAPVEQGIVTTKVDNPGGPVIPGMGAPARLPENSAAPAPAPAPTPAPDTQTAPVAAPDLDALRGLLGSESESPTSQNNESLETGNPVLDAGIQMLQKTAGLNNDDIMRAMGNAIKFNNPELIDSAYLKERFKEHAEYAELLCKAYYQDREKQAQSLVKTAYDAAGGEAQWNVVRDVFKAKAPAHQQAAARALIDSGKVQEGVSLIMDYCQREGLVIQQGSQVRGQSGLASAALSAAEFSAEYSKLREEAGNRSMESRQFKQRYDDLLARRAAGKKLGR